MILSKNLLKPMYFEYFFDLDKEIERTNAYGIMEGSTLRITVVEAQDLFATKGSPYVTVSVGDQRKATRYIPSTLKPVWNEELALYFLV